MKYTIAFALASATANARLMGAYEYTTPAPTDDVNVGGPETYTTPAPTDDVNAGTPAPGYPTPCPEPTTYEPVSPTDPTTPCTPTEDYDDEDVDTASPAEEVAPAGQDGYETTDYAAGSAASTTVALASMVLPIVAYLL